MAGRAGFTKSAARPLCARAGALPCLRHRRALHPSYVLYGQIDGRRFSLYIPDKLAPQLRLASANGRNLKALLAETGRRYTLALKHERDRTGG